MIESYIYVFRCSLDLCYMLVSTRLLPDVAYANKRACEIKLSLKGYESRSLHHILVLNIP